MTCEEERIELLALILEQVTEIRNLKIKLRMYEGEFYPPDDYKDYPKIVKDLLERL